MHLALELIGCKETDFDDPGLIGLKHDTLQSSKESDDPTAVVEAVSRTHARERFAAGRQALERDVEGVGGVANVTNHSVDTNVLIWCNFG